MPTTGQGGVTYITSDKKNYQWDGTEYVEVMSSPIEAPKNTMTAFIAHILEKFTPPTEVGDEVALMLADYIDATNKQIAILSTIKEKLDGWIVNLNNKLDTSVYYYTFQGAFNDFAREKLLDTRDTHDSSDISGKYVSESQVLDYANSLYTELTRIIKQQSYQDEQFIITEHMTMAQKFAEEQSLYNKAISVLSRLAVPSSRITVEAEPFVFNTDYQDITKELNMGMGIYAELPSGDVPMYMLTGIELDYDVPSCTLTFSNRLYSADPTRIFAELESTANTAATIIASERIDWGVKSEKINELMVEKDADINGTLKAMSNSINNTSIGADGFKCFALDANNQETYGMWGANGVLMFRDKDGSGNWQNRAAIGRIIRSDGSIEYGFYGEKIIANSITADKLAVGSVSKGSNLIRNGSFEGHSGGNMGTILITDWTLYSSQNTSTEFYEDYVNTEEEYSGHYCAYLSHGNYIVQNPIIVPKDGEYNLSYYCRRALGDEQSSVTVRIVGSGSSNYEYVHTIESSAIGWNRVNCGHFNLNAGTYEFSIAISVAENNGDVRVMLDDILLEEGYQLNAYTPHISEMYATYTSINDSGVQIFGGNLTLYDANGGKQIYTDNDNLIVRGTVFASAGKIGSDISGWQIDSRGLIYSGRRDGDVSKPYYMGLRASNYGTAQDGTPTNATSDSFKVIYAGSHSPDSNDPPEFYVTADGSLHATKATIKGNITADSGTFNGTINASLGTIGGWSIGPNGLSKSDNDKSIYLNSNVSSSNYFIHAGDNNHYFRVYGDGSIKATDADITGTVRATAGYFGTLYVTNQGNSYLTNGLTIGGSVSNGSLTTPSYSWTVEADSTHTKLMSTEISGFQTYIQASNNTNANAFAAGNKTTPDFYIQQNGYMHASKGEFLGEVISKAQYYTAVMAGGNISFNKNDANNTPIARMFVGGNSYDTLRIESEDVLIGNTSYSVSSGVTFHFQCDNDYALFCKRENPNDTAEVCLGFAQHPWSTVYAKALVLVDSSGGYKTLTYNQNGEITWS